LGSNAKTTFLSKEKIAILLEAFGKLKQRVIMKWESDTLEGKPANVMISKWLPQDDILAHPNTKLFISQCDLGSVVESRYRGVPILSMPFFDDQEKNTQVIVNEGWVLRLDSASFSVESLTKAMMKMLENPQYSNTIKRISSIYRDRPMNGRETAIYWIEYVIRHRGAPHMQYDEVHLNFFQANSIDIVLFIIISTYLRIKIFGYLKKFIMPSIKFVCRKLRLIKS